MIVLFCGLPGSGKTTLATGLSRRLAARGYAVALVHSDDFDRNTYDRIYDRVAAGTADGPPDCWLLDGTFYERAHRNRFYRLGDVAEVWVRASVETCLRRNRARSDLIPTAGVHAMASEFEPPRADLELDTEALTVGEALDGLEAAVLEWLSAESPEVDA